jgi:2-methylcitrate dehydratase PrpD
MSDDRSLVERFVQHALHLRYEDLPSEAVDIARWLVFDSLGTGLGGYQRELGRKAAAFAAARRGPAEATVLGSGLQTTAEEAAFANGVMIKILGMDDSHRTGSHIASQVVPAALATAEAHGTSGRDLLTAIVATYDLAVRVGHTVRKAQRRRGLDIKGTVGAMAAALVAGLCAGLDEKTLANAVALAADLSSGTEQYVYEGGACDTKDLIAGFAARNGVFAVNLAQSGFYGPRRALDGEYGFFRAFGDGYDASTFDDLGRHFAITTTAFKPHGGCRHTHQAVDAVQQILTEGPLDPAQISGITVQTYQAALQPYFRIDPEPPSQGVAGLSIRVAVAVALAQGSAWPNDFRHWDDPQARRLRRLVTVAVEPDIEENYPNMNGSRVILTMENGQRLEGYVANAKGEPEFRMSPQELHEKFEVLTQDLLAAEAIAEIYAICNHLEEEPDVNRLLALTAAPELQVVGA